MPHLCKLRISYSMSIFLFLLPFLLCTVLFHFPKIALASFSFFWGIDHFISPTFLKNTTLLYITSIGLKYSIYYCISFMLIMLFVNFFFFSIFFSSHFLGLLLPCSSLRSFILGFFNKIYFTSPTIFPFFLHFLHCLFFHIMSHSHFDYNM